MLPIVITVFPAFVGRIINNLASVVKRGGAKQSGASRAFQGITGTVLRLGHHKDTQSLSARGDNRHNIPGPDVHTGRNGYLARTIASYAHKLF